MWKNLWDEFNEIEFMRRRMKMGQRKDEAGTKEGLDGTMEFERNERAIRGPK